MAKNFLGRCSLAMILSAYGAATVAADLLLR